MRIDTPVALLIFNRPETTEQVFAEIARARPPVLLVVADGARADRPGESERCEQARKIATRVNWPCDVRTEFATANLGCRLRISSGLDWVFSEVDEAIVLEDDCLPDPSFFPYCEELLRRYRGDDRVMMVSGDCFTEMPPSGSYYFTRYAHIWGWAGWRRAWRRYDVGMTTWPARRDSGWLRQNFNHAEARYWRRTFDAVHTGGIDTWDYQWTYACFEAGGWSIAPTVNLVRNIGFGAGATHTHDAAAVGTAQFSRELSFPLTHPVHIKPDAAADHEEGHRLYSHRRPSVLQRWGRSLRKRIVWKR